MVLIKALTLAAALLPLASFAVAPAPGAEENSGPRVPGAYIVEFVDDHDTDAFYAKLGDAGFDVERRMELKYKLFKGLSFKLNNARDEDESAQSILAMPEVRRISPVTIIPRPRDIVHWTGKDGTPPPGVILEKRDVASNLTTFSTHTMTQVDKLRARGYKGKGVKVAIIDTGVDFTHPALGNGCFGPGCVVSFGADLVGNDYFGYNEPVPGKVPVDCIGHGTHVAGTIAAQANTLYGFTGAAPDVTLGMYKVFGCKGDSTNEILIAAHNRAFEDGADIITASIGGTSGWTETPYSVAVSRIVEAGTICTVSAGNDGDQGLFYTAQSANGKRVTSIASVDNSVGPALLVNATFSVNNASKQDFSWTLGAGDWGNISLPLYSLGFNTSDPANACEPLPASTPDLSDYLVLVRRGTCPFVDKIQNVVDKGGRYIMFYNNVAGTVSASYTVDGLKASGMVSAKQGAAWVGELSRGNKVTVNIQDPTGLIPYYAEETNKGTGGFLSTYTSWGPTFDLDVKPQFSTPGGLILSTYPVDQGSYAILSGTSMACPLAAALFALVGEVRGTFDPATLENVLSATAKPNLFNTGANAPTLPYLAPVPQQGAGLLQAYDAAFSSATLSVPSISFNDTEHFDGERTFYIKNTGSKDVTFVLSHVPAGTFYTLAGNGNNTAEAFPNTHADAVASVKFASPSVIVTAGGNKAVQLTLKQPVGLDTSRLPVYSGYIVMNGTDGTNLSLPYQGVAGIMRKATILNAEGTFVSQSDDLDNQPIKANTTFLLPKDNSTLSNDTAYPVLSYTLNLGTANLRVDLSPVDGSTPGAGRAPRRAHRPRRRSPTSPSTPLRRLGAVSGAGVSRFVSLSELGPTLMAEDSPSTPATTGGGSGANVTEVLGIKTVGQLIGFPIPYLPRFSNGGLWDGTLDTGKMAPPGTYRIVFRALKIFGDSNKAEDWETIKSEPFHLKYF